MFELLEPRWAPANSPPLTPVITEPSREMQAVSSADVHMEIGPFSDPDPADVQEATQWEIWTSGAAAQIAWSAIVTSGVERRHIHLGDGTFVGAHQGRSELDPDADYQLRVRVRDNSGEVSTQWSAFATRGFHTTPLTQTLPLEISDISSSPEPHWQSNAGEAIVLPGGETPAQLSLESQLGVLLLGVQGTTGAANQLTNPPPLSGHAQVRVVVSSGTSGLSLPQSELTVVDDRGTERSIYLPAVQLLPNQSAYFWISANGGTFYGTAAQGEPDFSNLARGAPVPWTVASGYRVEVVATGFQLPVSIAFVPNAGNDPDDPLYYVSELYGTIKVVRRDGRVSDYATNLLNFNPTGDFPGSGEQGLTGLAVDPISGDVFASMVYSSVDGVENVPHYPKVVRFHSNNGGITADTQTTILDMPGETQGQSHQISNLTIGPDRKLYVHNGDGFDAATAQNLDSFRGKILRLNLDGTAPDDNPFFAADDGISARDYLFAYGFRNPFGGVWRAADGKHYELENGPSVDRLAQVSRGANYRWDGTDDSMRNSALYNWDPAIGPVNLAFVEQATFGGSGFPSSKWDHAFVSQSGFTWASGPQNNAKSITEFVLDAAGNRVSGPITFVSYNGTGKATVAALAAGPDGLYFSDLYKDLDYASPIDRGANILRIRFVGDAAVVAGAETDDTFYIRTSANGSSVEVFDTNPPRENPVYTSELDTLNTLTIRAGDGADTITIDYGNGSPVPAGGLWISGDNGDDSLAVFAGGRPYQFDRAIHYDSGAGINTLALEGGKARVESVSTNGQLSTTVLGGGQLVTSRLVQDALSLSDATSTVAILPGGIQASVLTSLQIAPGATLDISDNALVLDYSGDSPLAGVREQIFSGRGQAGFGASWSGAGITSSSATQINLSEPESRSVGYAENALLPLGPYSSFHEVGVDSTAVLIAYTRTGDANLDALVDDNDVTIFGATYEPGVSRPHWALGDFDYNGFIDDDDVTLLGVFYNSVSGAPPLPPARTDFAHRDQVAKERTALHHVTTYISLTANATVEGWPVDALDERRLALPRTRNRLGR